MDRGRHRVGAGSSELQIPPGDARIHRVRPRCVVEAHRRLVLEVDAKGLPHRGADVVRSVARTERMLDLEGDAAGCWVSRRDRFVRTASDQIAVMARATAARRAVIEVLRQRCNPDVVARILDAVVVVVEIDRNRWRRPRREVLHHHRDVEIGPGVLEPNRGRDRAEGEVVGGGVRPFSGCHRAVDRWRRRGEPGLVRRAAGCLRETRQRERAEQRQGETGPPQRKPAQPVRRLLGTLITAGPAAAGTATLHPLLP